MKSLRTFTNTVTQSFWVHVLKNTYIPFDEGGSRKDFLKKLHKEIVGYVYSPEKPRAYVIEDKHNLVARIVPALSLKDYCVYFYCIKRLEDKLAVNRTPGTFGGFRLGNPIKKKEDADFESASKIAPSISGHSYNPVAWIKAWRDFQKKAWVFSRQGNYKYFIFFDIANFYDSINLDILEKGVLRAVSKKSHDETNLLFNFLTNWNKKFNRYSKQSIGLPQDEVGDCSRILANFYLQNYDRAIHRLSTKLKAKYLRYSDDQIIMAQSKKDAEYILFQASKLMKEIGLNINAGKVKIFKNPKEFDYYWAFEIFDLLGNKKDFKSIAKAGKMYVSRNKEKFRFASVLSRLLTCNLNGIKGKTRKIIISELLDKKFLATSEAREIKKIYDLLDKKQQRLLLRKLKDLVNETNFNSFHYNMIKLSKLGVSINFTSDLKKRIKDIEL